MLDTNRTKRRNKRKREVNKSRKRGYYRILRRRIHNGGLTPRCNSRSISQPSGCIRRGETPHNELAAIRQRVLMSAKQYMSAKH